jgi:zinc transport system ATP-binding protein
VAQGRDTTETLIRCRGLQVGHAGRALLPALDCEICAGELLVILGRNGSGKTTLFRTLLGLLSPVAGRVEREPKLALCYVAQRSQLDPIYPALARDVVAMGLDRGWSLLRPRIAEPPEVRDALQRVGAVALADRPFRELSEGQKQRVLLARTLAARPRLALLDEPTSAMDEVAERETIAQLDWLRREHGTTVMIVSHHLGSLHEVADGALLLDSSCGELVVGTVDEVMAHPVYAHNYGDSHPRAGGAS